MQAHPQLGPYILLSAYPGKAGIEPLFPHNRILFSINVASHEFGSVRYARTLIAIFYGVLTWLLIYTVALHVEGELSAGLRIRL